MSKTFQCPSGIMVTIGGFMGEHFSMLTDAKNHHASNMASICADVIIDYGGIKPTYQDMMRAPYKDVIFIFLMCRQVTFDMPDEIVIEHDGYKIVGNDENGKPITEEHTFTIVEKLPNGLFTFKPYAKQISSLDEFECRMPINYNGVEYYIDLLTANHVVEFSRSLKGKSKTDIDGFSSYLMRNFGKYTVNEETKRKTPLSIKKPNGLDYRFLTVELQKLVNDNEAQVNSEVKFDNPCDVHNLEKPYIIKDLANDVNFLLGGRMSIL